MPLVIDRRSFLIRAIAAGSLVRSAFRLGADPGAVVRLALLSDTHIAGDRSDSYRGFTPFDNLQKTIAQVTALPFDGVIVNGDMARLEGKQVDYARFAEMTEPLADRGALVVTLGNHDDRRNARKALSRLSGETQAVEQKFVTVFEAGQLRFILLDSLLATNIAPGQLGKSQRDWLDKYLAGHPEMPTVILVHHNPDPESDSGLVDAARLLAILQPHRHVKALIFGHTHTYRREQANGLHLINLPAVGYNFADGEAVGWIEAAFTPAGATLKLHAIAGETKNDGAEAALNWRV
jgi:3',5'-cyclic AMP phosphodiesterase CpdA